jgi:hypothetical protein
MRGRQRSAGNAGFGGGHATNSVVAAGTFG